MKSRTGIAPYDSSPKLQRGGLSYKPLTIFQADALYAIADERDRQDTKWGEQNHSDERWLAILTEEVGEASRDILEDKPDSLEVELQQVAAVAVAWLESIRRRRKTE